MDHAPEVIAVLMVVAAVVLYLAPSITAQARHKRNLSSIVLVNLFLGWTVIGWVVALVWALVKDVPQQTATTA